MIQSWPMSPKFKEFLAHWKALQVDGRVTLLADFLDNPLPDLQPWILVFDVEGDMTLRLLGTAMADFYGRDFTGKTSHEIYKMPMDGLRFTHAQIAQNFCGCISPSMGRTSQGRTPALYSLGLPLLRKDGVSIVWLVEPGTPLGPGETGMPVRRLASLQWIDLGFGIPA